MGNKLKRYKQAIRMVKLFVNCRQRVKKKKKKGINK